MIVQFVDVDGNVYHDRLNKHSRMDSPDKLATLGAQDTIRRQTNIYEKHSCGKKKKKKKHFNLNEYLTDKGQQPLFSAS